MKISSTVLKVKQRTRFTYELLQRDIIPLTIKAELQFLFSAHCLRSFVFVTFFTKVSRGGRVARWCCVNFQCWGVLLIWISVGQGPTALAVGAGGGLFGHFFSHLSFLFSFSLSLGETARYRLNQPTKVSQRDGHNFRNYKGA